jgi:hypothetical protein
LGLQVERMIIKVSGHVPNLLLPETTLVQKLANLDASVSKIIEESNASAEQAKAELAKTNAELASK